MFRSKKEIESIDLEHDLSAIEDGTVLYVSATPKAQPEQTANQVENSNDNNSASDNGHHAASNNNEESTIDIDPLESVKRAYQQQEVYHQPTILTSVDEIIDHYKQKSFEALRSKITSGIAQGKDFGSHL